MKKIRVHTPFTFNDTDYTKTDFDVGTHNVKNDIADHWFTQRHAEVLDKGTPDNGDPEQVSLLQQQITELQQQVADLSSQLLSANSELVVRNEKITELQQQVTDLTGATNGAKK